jgi:hypothetical protein
MLRFCSSVDLEFYVRSRSIYAYSACRLFYALSTSKASLSLTYLSFSSYPLLTVFNLSERYFNSCSFSLSSAFSLS